MFTSHSSDSNNDLDENMRHVLSSSPTIPTSPLSKQQQSQSQQEDEPQQQQQQAQNESPSPSSGVSTPSPVSSSSSASSSSFFDMRDDDRDYTRVPSAPLKSIKDIGFVEDQNARFRRTMEDGHIMIDGFRGRDHEGYYAIYDGHGGKTAVTHVQKVMHKIFERELSAALDNINSSNSQQRQISHEEAVRQAFANAYRLTDNELKDAQYNGTTAITCYLARDDQTNSKVLYTANCGDARVVISVNGEAKRLTFDHKASEESEVSRIRNSNGFVAYCRVNGILAVTRALGDHAMKQWVISDPYQTSIQLSDSPNDDSFVILACDGLWDVFNDQECVDYVKDLFSHHMTCQQVSKKLLEKALEKGSTDNISIMVIKL